MSLCLQGGWRQHLHRANNFPKMYRGTESPVEPSGLHRQTRRIWGTALGYCPQSNACPCPSHCLPWDSEFSVCLCQMRCWFNGPLWSVFLSLTPTSSFSWVLWINHSQTNFSLQSLGPEVPSPICCDLGSQQSVDSDNQFLSRPSCTWGCSIGAVLHFLPHPGSAWKYGL